MADERSSAKPSLASGSLILAHFIEQQLEGWTFHRDHWPLHITLVPWFATEDEEAVMRSLDRLAATTSPLLLTVGGREQFGIRHKSVNVISNQKPLLSLHQKLLATLEEADVALHQGQFVGKDYMGHITRYDAEGRHSNEGERVLMNDFHAVRLVDDNTYLVEQQFLLAVR